MAYRTITITSNQPVKDATGSGTIKPGMGLVRTSTADTVQAHNVDRGRVNGNLVAIEDSLQGHGLSDDYSTGNKVFFRSFLPGDEVLLYIALGQNISIGDELVSNGAGYFEKETEDSSSHGTQEIVTFATALEACDATSAAARCRCEIAS